MKLKVTTPLEREVLSCLADHPMSMVSLKKTLHAKHEHTSGFDAILAHAMERMLKKHLVAHVAGHTGTFRLSKAMAAKEEKKRAMQMKKAAVAKKPVKKQGVKAKAGKNMMAKKKTAKKA